MREGVHEDQLMKGVPTPELNNVVYEVASTAKVGLLEHKSHQSAAEAQNFNVSAATNVLDSLHTALRITCTSFAGTSCVCCQQFARLRLTQLTRRQRTLLMLKMQPKCAVYSKLHYPPNCPSYEPCHCWYLIHAGALR